MKAVLVLVVFAALSAIAVILVVLADKRQQWGRGGGVRLAGDGYRARGRRQWVKAVVSLTVLVVGCAGILCDCRTFAYLVLGGFLLVCAVPRIMVVLAEGRQPGAEGAQQALEHAVDLARRALAQRDVADDWSKKRELVGVLSNLRAAQSALRSGFDMEGGKISPQEIGLGLDRMLGVMRNCAIWFRLQVNVSASTQQVLQTLQEALEASVRSLR